MSNIYALRAQSGLQPAIRTATPSQPYFEGSDKPSDIAVKRKRPGLLKRAGRILLMLTALTGAGQIYETRFPPQFPQLNSVSMADIPMHVKVRINSTEHLPSIRQSDALNQHPEHWRKLQSTLEIARFLSPEIEEWVRDRYANNAIFIDPSTDATLRVNATLNRLYIGSSFWQYSDGEKAAALAHEYAHYKQGPVKHAKVRISQLLSATVSDYNNELEREAFLYHREALEALRLQESRSYYSVMEMLREFGQIHRQGH